MSREWLKPFALGVATASIASVGAWLYSQFVDSHQLLVITYVKAEGLDQPKLPPDPAPQYNEPSEYVIRIARGCGIKSWTMQSEVNVDMPVEARLEVRWADVSNKMFNCVAKFVRPQRGILAIKDAKSN